MALFTRTLTVVSSCMLLIYSDAHCMNTPSASAAHEKSIPALSPCRILFDDARNRCAVWSNMHLNNEDVLSIPTPYVPKVSEQGNVAVDKITPEGARVHRMATPTEYARLNQASPINVTAEHEEQSIHTQSHTLLLSVYSMRLIECRNTQHDHKTTLLSHQHPRTDVANTYAAAEIKGYPLVVFAPRDEQNIHYVYFGPSRKHGILPLRHKKYTCIQQLIFSTQDNPADSDSIDLGVVRSTQGKTAYAAALVRLTCNAQGTITHSIRNPIHSVTASPDDINNRLLMECTLGFNPPGTLFALATRMTHRSSDDKLRHHTYAYTVNCYDTASCKPCENRGQMRLEYCDATACTTPELIRIPHLNNDASMCIIGKLLVQCPILPAISHNTYERYAHALGVEHGSNSTPPTSPFVMTADGIHNHSPTTQSTSSSSSSPLNDDDDTIETICLDSSSENEEQ